MVTEQDYMMRQIREILRALWKLLFDMDLNSKTEEMLEGEEERSMWEHISGLVDQGKIHQAETDIYDGIDDGNSSSLKLALLFYSYLNDQSDEFLAESGFDRNKIKAGIEMLTDIFGMGSIMHLFGADM